jgi:hypothetical protein
MSQDTPIQGWIQGFTKRGGGGGLPLRWVSKKKGWGVVPLLIFFFQKGIPLSNCGCFVFCFCFTLLWNFFSYEKGYKFQCGFRPAFEIILVVLLILLTDRRNNNVPSCEEGIIDTRRNNNVPSCKEGIIDIRRNNNVPSCEEGIIDIRRNNNLTCPAVKREL